MIDRLTEIIQMRQQGMSLQAIGDRYGISRQRVYQLLTPAPPGLIVEHMTERMTEQQTKTKAQGQRILEYIQDYTLAMGIPPTYRDIQRYLGISSTSVVDYHLALLERIGKIKRMKGVARGIVLVK